MIEMYIADVLQKDGEGKLIKESRAKAELFKAYYNGDGKKLDEILLNYRVRESENQKNQRKRITISRTKHVTKQIENVLDQLDIMDKPAINIVCEKEEIRNIVGNWVYNNNISSYAFNAVKYHNLIDANSFMIAAVNKYGEVEFKPYTSDSLYDVYVVNGVLQVVTFVSTRKTKEKEVNDYHVYFNEGIYHLVNKDEAIKAYAITDQTPVIGDYYAILEPTSMMYAFKLGYITDATTNQKLCTSILDAASELYKSLIWEGSEFDTTKGTHGILKQFTYAKACSYRESTPENGIDMCINGYMSITNTKCKSCHGSGLQVHTSSQDVMTYPFPNESQQNPLKLSDLTHTVFVPDGFLNFRKQEIEDVKFEILHTIFNSTTFTKSEIAATATEKMIDLQGIYSTLNQLGKQVSELFIWMCEVYCAVNNYQDVSILHGYTLNLKLETVEDLALKRKNLVEANAPSEVIQAVDLAILQKQHIDSPEAIDRFSIWEQHRPFADKSEQLTMQILASLADKNKYKVLYYFWGQIKNSIIIHEGNQFYDKTFDQRQAIIDNEVEKIIADLGNSELPRPGELIL